MYTVVSTKDIVIIKLSHEEHRVFEEIISIGLA